MRGLFVLVAVVAVLAGCTPSPHSLAYDVLASKLAILAVQDRPTGENIFQNAYFETRDALGAWADERVATFGADADVDKIAKNLNGDLTRFFCKKKCEAAPGDFDGRGHLGEVTVKRVGQYLVVQTALGILCGYDETGYIYAWRDQKWTRLWQSARTPAAGGAYEPEVLVDVMFTPAQGDATYIATVGQFPWCTSNWQPIYYRLWDVKAAQPILDKQEFAFVPAVGMGLKPDNFFVALKIASIDPSILVRLGIFRYQFDRGRAVRTVPYALTPRSFVEEWLTSPWTTSTTLSAPAHEEALHAEHTRHYSERVSGDFVSNTHVCDDGQSWEIGIAFPDGERYFHVTRRAASEFELVSVAEDYAPECGKEDAAADEEDGPFQAFLAQQ